MNLHEICRKKRREKDMTQKRLSEYVNIDHSAISRFEKTGSGISTDALQRLIDFFEIKINGS